MEAIKAITVRIYLKIDDLLANFYWVTLGKDGSVYFGSAHSKNPKRGFCGTNSSENGSVKLDGENTRTLSQEELKTKFSLHNSGTFILPNNEGEKRKRSYTLKLENYSRTIPFVGVIPHRLKKYKETKKTIKPHDLVLNVSELQEQPFAISLHLNHENKSNLSKLFPREKFDIFKCETTNLGKYELGAAVYADTKTFNKWPELEYSCTFDPKITSGELPWIIFQSF